MISIPNNSFLKVMKTKYFLCCCALALSVFRISGQDCIHVSGFSAQTCLLSIVRNDKALKALRNAPVQSPEQLFYQYFMGTGYAGYKQLFLPADWFGLSESDFNAWRSFSRDANVRLSGTVVFDISGHKIGFVKYTYVIDDMLLYEIFSAKYSGGQWRPTSVKEDAHYAHEANFVKYINLEYLESLTRLSHRDAGAAPMSVPMALLVTTRDSLQLHQPEVFAERFNGEFTYLTNTKFNEDRRNDGGFIAFLQEMKLTQDQVAVVMKYIYAHEYLRAATVADKFSTETYVYSPFVDKIREIYGHDRIRKWDPATQNWY
jgi:hypothetical protein